MGISAKDIFGLQQGGITGIEKITVDGELTFNYNDDRNNGKKRFFGELGIVDSVNNSQKNENRIL